MYGLIGLLSLLPTWIRWGALASIVTVVGGLVFTYDARGKKIERMTQEITSLKKTVAVADANLKLREGEVDALDERLSISKTDLINSCEALWRSESGHDSEAVDSVLDSIRGIEDQEENNAN